MRYLPLCSVIAVCVMLSVAQAEVAATFVVQNGEAPWSDRAGTWELGDVPDSLKGTDPLPQGSCSARSLSIAGKPASITVGVSEADVDGFKKQFPNAKETGEKFIIRHPKETTGLPYVAIKLPDPPETISAGDTPFGAGLVLLKIEANAKP